MLEIQYIDIKLLIPYANNSRTHDEGQIKQIAASIKEFGFTNPVLIDEDNGIIAGHGRIMAASLLKMDKVPCITLKGLTPAQKKAYVIADNKLALNAGWDLEMLKVEFESLQEMEFNIDVIGFSEDELNDLFPKEPIDGLTDEDAVPEAPETPVTILGDIWQLGDHRLMCGDSTDAGTVALLMGGQKADMVFADPPYGINVVKNKKVGGGGITKFKKNTNKAAMVQSSDYCEIIGDDTTDTAKKFYETCLELNFKNIVIWGGNYFTDFLPPSRCWLAWDKEMTGNFSQAEMAWTSFSKGGIKVFKFLWNGLSREGNRKDELSKRVHPTQKPVGLFQNIFKRFDGFKSIYDGFLGSGSTLIACEKTGQICYGIELDPHYCDVVIKRWEQFTGKKATLDGQVYDEVKSKRLS